ncbi:MAG TPA: AraC family transcriptional regulator [Candidatus Acidoferrales bacterium]|nr:AraC family transcriptional regulator [Candidatus Acidoferrales bacterium]
MIDTTYAFRSRLLAEDVQRRILYYPRTLAAAQYVREHVGEPIRLETAASLAGMTPCAFSRYFAEKVGITFSTLVKTLRIEHALASLEERDGAISALAAQTGYQSCCTFSRAFKDVMGQSPSEYRRRMLFER